MGGLFYHSLRLLIALSGFSDENNPSPKGLLFKNYYCEQTLSLLFLNFSDFLLFFFLKNISFPIVDFDKTEIEELTKLRKIKDGVALLPHCDVRTLILKVEEKTRVVMEVSDLRLKPENMFFLTYFLFTLGGRKKGTIVEQIPY